jgi:hypothetical protein
MMTDRSDEENPADVSCARCGAALASARDGVEVTGAHTHAVDNPGGHCYRIGCYRAAPGCVAAGETSHEHTWFAGYTWQRAFCRGCSAHAGWLFRARTNTFFGLILAPRNLGADAIRD